MQKYPIQSKDIVPEFIPDAFEKLRRERKEQSAKERILDWFCAAEDTTLGHLGNTTPTCRRSTRSRPPLGNIPNHNTSSNVHTSLYLREFPLKKRKASLFEAHCCELQEDSTIALRDNLSPNMDIPVFEDAVPSSAAPKTPSPRKRGRPKKGVVVEEQDPAMAIGRDIKSPLGLSSLSVDPFVMSPQPQEADISLSPPKSPSKTSNVTRTASIITKKEKLAYMTPPSRFLTLREVKDIGGLPEMTSQLWLTHIRPALSETRVIPAHLEDQLITASNTPMKSKPLMSTNSFGSVAHYDPIDHNLVWLTVSDVVFMTEEYRNRGTESHWTSVVVNPLLQLVRQLTKFQKGTETPMLEVLDITTVEISPRSLCPSAEEPALFKDLNKRIDCAVGLRLSRTEKRILERGRFQANSEPSINQTSTFVNMTPMFMNIEVKRSHSNQDPLIQLAVWITAEFEKRQIEGYSFDMPVLAIAVVEEKWELYMVYAAGNDGGRYDCNFVGPFEMGSTTSVEGAFRILGVLCSLASWGLSDYRAWFEREILAKYKV